MNKQNVSFFAVGGLIALLLCVALGFGLGTQSGNVSSWLWSIVPEKAEQTEGDASLMIESMRVAYEEMLAERKKNSNKNVSTVSDVVPEIIMFTRSDCVHCRRWIGSEAARFRALGWQIATSEDKDYFYPRVPHFIVTDCARSVEVSGYMTVERLAEVLR